MLSYLEALRKIFETARPLPWQNVPLSKLNGYFMAEAACTKFPLPRFDNSAVDGYGVFISDLAGASQSQPKRLVLAGEIAAGQQSDCVLKAGTTIKIFTGAKVPDSVEAVVMREFCQESHGVVQISTAVAPKENIRAQGAEFASGQEIIKSQTRITPPIIGLLATLGYAEFAVHRKPRIAIVVTGDELVAPGNNLADSQIYDSNSFALEAALNDLGIADVRKFYAQDTERETKEAFKKAIACSDVIISSGGVSVGDHDYVKESLEALSVKTIFWRIAVKPGKPVYFGVAEKNQRVEADEKSDALSNELASDKLVFGLPGNPVSVLVTYHQFVKPALLQLMGCSAPDNRLQTVILKNSLHKKAGRLDFVRATVESTIDGMFLATPTRGQDSHMMTGLAAADCLLHFDAELEESPIGAKMVSTPINWHG